jgi:hypothetical protein
MKKSTKSMPEIQQRAVRIVSEAKGRYEFRWAAIVSTAASA